MGWRAYAAACVVAVALLYVPGYLGFRCLRMRRLEALCLAPAFSLCLTAILGVIFGVVGVPATWLGVAGIPAIVLAAVAAIEASVARAGRARGAHARGLALKDALSRDDARVLALYLAAGCALAILLFAGAIDGAASFESDNDNSFHLNLIRAIFESGNYSPLSSSVYAASAVSPDASASFYPNAFHCIAASVMSLIPVGASVAENAVVTVIIGVIYPLSMFWLMRLLFAEDPVALHAGAFTSLFFVAFPWRLISWGPLFPNMLSMALIPAGLATFISFLRSLAGRAGRVRSGAAFLALLVAIGLAHPNGVFTLAVMGAGYLCAFLWSQGRERGLGRARSALAVAAFLLIACGIWAALYKLPALQSVVTFKWWPYEGFGTGLLDVLDLKLSDTQGGQPALAILVLAGLAACLIDDRRHAWLVAVYAFMAVQFAACAALTGTARHLLAGFWYTDPRRLAANLVLVGAPLAALGASWLIRLLGRLLVHDGAACDGRGPRRVAAPSFAILALLVATLCLGHAAHASNGGDFSGYTLPSEGFAANESLIEAKYARGVGKAYDIEDQRFTQEALTLVPAGSAILNLPNDGSCFAYALDGANVYYKSVDKAHIFGTGETEADAVLRLRLDKVATDDSVRQALSSLGIHYLLLLDQGDHDRHSGNVLPEYLPNEWRGFMRVTDDTPGFKVLLARGDMRLYEIQY